MYVSPLQPHPSCPWCYHFFLITTGLRPGLSEVCVCTFVQWLFLWWFSGWIYVLFSCNTILNLFKIISSLTWFWCANYEEFTYLGFVGLWWTWCHSLKSPFSLPWTLTKFLSSRCRNWFYYLCVWWSSLPWYEDDNIVQWYKVSC